MLERRPSIDPLALAQAADLREIAAILDHVQLGPTRRARLRHPVQLAPLAPNWMIVGFAAAASNPVSTASLPAAAGAHFHFSHCGSGMSFANGVRT